jgi:hypothetical protein
MKNLQFKNVFSSTGSPQISEVEVGLLEREAAEGSESVDAVHASRANLAPGLKTTDRSVKLIQTFLIPWIVHHLRFTPERQSEDSGLSHLPRPLLPLDQLLLQKDDSNYGILFHLNSKLQL